MTAPGHAAASIESGRISYTAEADYAGPDSNHAKLGTARAKAFCKALKAYGAEVTFSVKNYKGSRPVIVGGKASNRDENRRVVILVTRDRR